MMAGSDTPLVVEVPWRVRLRYWWWYRRLSPEQRILIDRVNEMLDHSLLYGEGGLDEYLDT